MIEIGKVFNNEVTGWKRNIEFTYEGKTYGLLLSWDEDYGFDDVVWNENGNVIKRPDWVNDYYSKNIGETGYYSLCFDLDDLTCRKNIWPVSL
jgi:hypothetical protein